MVDAYMERKSCRKKESNLMNFMIKMQIYNINTLHLSPFKKKEFSLHIHVNCKIYNV